MQLFNALSVHCGLLQSTADHALASEAGTGVYHIQRL